MYNSELPPIEWSQAPLPSISTPTEPQMPHLSHQHVLSAQHNINCFLLKLLRSKVASAHFQAPKQPQQMPAFPISIAAQCPLTSSWAMRPSTSPMAESRVVDTRGTETPGSTDSAQSEFVALDPRKIGIQVQANLDHMFLDTLLRPDQKASAALDHLRQKQAAHTLLQVPQQSQQMPAFPISTAAQFPAASPLAMRLSTSPMTDSQAVDKRGTETPGSAKRDSTEFVALYPRKKIGIQVQANPDPVLLDKEALSALYHLPLKEAAKALGICPTAIKTACRKLGLTKWPYRKLRKQSRRRMLAQQHRARSGGTA